MNRIIDHPVAEKPRECAISEFAFDGASMQGHEGEMLSSALFANGIRTFSEHPRHAAGRTAPQGIFCANGQCSQCTVIVNGTARKACITPLASGMDVRSLRGVPPLPAAAGASVPEPLKTYAADILVIGGGPSGLSAATELSDMGYSVLLAEDKDRLGGKLVLQTHKFFGSEEDCYAGTRGYDIARRLEEKVRERASIRVLANSPVVGIYADRKAGIFEDYERYALVDFKAVLVAAGAREKSVLFPGNDLPGVYGAGAFQTLVNRDLVRAANRVFVVGSGNVGLIGSYHALQAGIEVAGICEILPEVNGYKVHADKIVRMGVPIHLDTTVVSVEGDGRVERVTIAKVDAEWRPLLDTARTFEVDTVLVATGLSPCDEFYREAAGYGFPAVKAGDADEIAEASSAMFGGRIAALTLAKLLGKPVTIDETWIRKREILKSKPGDILPHEDVVAGAGWTPVFFCDEEIPCNPCTTVCPTHSIKLVPRRGSLLDLPRFHGADCRGCTACVAACPGLAVSLVRTIDAEWTEVMLPFEFAPAFGPGDRVPLLDQSGAFLEDGTLIRKTYNKKYRTWILSCKASAANATKAIGVRVQREEATASLPEASFGYVPDDAIVCRCERISVGEMVAFIRENGVRDANQLKTLRVGMGACGSKTCSVLLPQVFRKAGVDPGETAPGTLRPLAMEVPLGSFAGKGKSA